MLKIIFSKKFRWVNDEMHLECSQLIVLNLDIQNYFIIGFCTMYKIQKLTKRWFIQQL